MRYAGTVLFGVLALAALDSKAGPDSDYSDMLALASYAMPGAGQTSTPTGPGDAGTGIRLASLGVITGSGPDDNKQGQTRPLRSGIWDTLGDVNDYLRGQYGSGALYRFNAGPGAGPEDDYLGLTYRPSHRSLWMWFGVQF